MPSDNEIEHIAKVAATAAAEVVAKANAAAMALTNTAASTAASLQAVQSSDLSRIKDDIAAINIKLDNKYVTKEEFTTVKTMAYDHETRLRTSEKGLTQIMTYGTGAIIVMGVAQFLISKFL